MREHPLRRQVVGEMHLRRWPTLQVPMTIVQLIRLVPEDARETERKAVGASEGARHVAGEFDETIRFTWERHSEASSLTLFIALPEASLFLNPRADSRVAQALDWAESLPGEVLRASCIWLAVGDAEAEKAVAAANFLASDLVSCRIGGGARLWSDFRIRADGYGSQVVAANGVHDGDLSRLVQRVEELANYRNLALLGLPVAQQCWPRLNDAEHALQALATNMLRTDMRDDDLLERTSALSLDLMSIAAAANFRMSATAAYSDLVDERLRGLAVEPVAGFQSLVDFSQRRFLPAVRTCASFTQRENQLSQRSAQFTSLLRTRIETRIENQNAKLLASMEANAARQLRLQQLVEGLSVVAVSYYTLGLLAYVFKGVEEAHPGFPAALAIGIAAVPLVLAIWFVLRRVKKRLLH